MIVFMEYTRHLIYLYGLLFSCLLARPEDEVSTPIAACSLCGSTSAHENKQVKNLIELLFFFFQSHWLASFFFLVTNSTEMIGFVEPKCVSSTCNFY